MDNQPLTNYNKSSTVSSNTANIPPHQNFNPVPKTISPIQIIIFFGVIIVIIVIVISLINIFHRNPYGPQTKIDNFSKYYNKTPTDTRDLTFSSLHNIISENLPEDIKVPTSGAKIRKDTNTSNFNSTTNVNYYTFMVDIESIQQSYYVQVSWTKNSDDSNLGGYPVMILCPSEDQLIYEPFDCKDSQTELGNTNNKAFSVLPVTVAYYSNNSFVKYEISCSSDSDEQDADIYINIKDYTGGNQAAAMAKIQELGLNPENYIIQYDNISDGLYLGPAPSD